jgi:hypothetical protein
MELGALPPKLPFDIVLLFGWRAKKDMGLVTANTT